MHVWQATSVYTYVQGRSLFPALWQCAWNTVDKGSAVVTGRVKN